MKSTKTKKPVALKTATIKQKAFVSATPAEVYDVFLDAKKHSKFTGGKATIARRVGGKFTAHDGYISGKNLKLESGRRIVQEWSTTDWAKGYKPSWIEFKFVSKKGGTEIHMTQKNVPAKQAASFKRGWIDFYWKPLKKYFWEK